MTIDDYAAKYGEDYPFVKLYKNASKQLTSGLDVQTLHIGFLWGQISVIEEDNERLKTELGKEAPEGAIEEVN